jgi:predicted phosphodiesterase
VKPKTALILGDIHFGFEHKKALGAAKKLAESGDYHTIVQLGDLIDGYSLSRFAKEPGKGITLKQEVGLARDFVTEMQDYCSFYLQVFGNHDIRIHKRLQEEPDLMSTHPSLAEMLGLPESRCVSYHTHYFIGKCAFTHDLGFYGTQAARQTLNAFQSNICFGHSHAASMVFGGDVHNERYVAVNAGWLGDAGACDYLPEARKKDWTLCVTTADFSYGGNVHLQIHPWINGKFLGI